MNDKELQYFIFASITSEHEDRVTEEEKQAMMAKYTEIRDQDKDPADNWSYILEPLKDEGKKKALLDLLTYNK